MAAETFRENPDFDSAEAITQLGVGEALVSTLEKKGIPTVVDRTLIRPPSSRLVPATEEERTRVMNASPVGSKYETVIDRESAFERLIAQAEKAQEDAPEDRRYSQSGSRSRGRSRQSVVETLAKSVARTVGSSLGRQIVRGLLGSLFKGR